MDLRLVTSFIKVYEKKSLRQAASELFISPQGLSRNLQNLEKELDVILFDRTVQVVSGRKKDISFVCSYGVMNALPYERFLTFQNRNPDYKISWREFPDQYALQKLYSEEYEFGLLVTDITKLEENYEAKKLFSPRMMVLVYEGHPLYENEVIDISDLENEKIIMEGADFWINEAFRQRCIEYGFCPEIIIETGDISFCHKLCSMKQGISITVDFIADFIDTENVRAIPFIDSDFLWNAYLVTNKKRVLSVPTRELCDFLLGKK